MKMKKSLSFMLVFATLISVFTACSKPSEPQSETTAAVEQTERQSQSQQSDAPIFLLEKLPEIGPFVNDIKYKRRFPEKRETLVPGEDYGKLIPFIERFKSYNFVDYETGEWEDEQYTLGNTGLMNTDGEVILDAVYDYSNVYPCSNGEYIIYLSKLEEETVVNSLICNSTGSWAVSARDLNLGYDYYEKIQDCVIITDNSDMNWEIHDGQSKLLVYDLKGNLLFEKENCSSEYLNYSEGYLVATIHTDYANWESHNVFLDKKGNIAFEGVCPKTGFKNGIAVACDKSGNAGLFSVDGKWIVKPEFEYIRYENGLYIASLNYFYVILDESGEATNMIPKSTVDSKGSITISNGKPYIDELDYTITPAKTTITDALTGEIVSCKETGSTIIGSIDENYLYCFDESGTYTYITDYEGNTVAKLEGTGTLMKINEKYFSFKKGSEYAAERDYELYTFDGFKKLWSDKIKNTGDRVNFWEYEEYIVKVYTPADQVDEYLANNTFDIIAYETGEVLIKGVEEYKFTQTGEKAYISCSDGTYTYLIDSDKNILMKTSNEGTD